MRSIRLPRFTAFPRSALAALCRWLAGTAGLLLTFAAPAQTLDARTLAALREGGHVIVFRHAETGPAYSDRAQAVFGDCSTQRNLNATGRAQAQRLGEDFRALGIPVARVLSSEFCRCWQHAEAMFGKARHDIHVGLTAPASYPSVTDADRARHNAQLEALLAQTPERGTNTVLVTHGVNVLLLTGYHPDVQGEAVIFRTGPQGRWQRVATVLPDGWRSKP